MSANNTEKIQKSQSSMGQKEIEAGVFPFWKNPGETLAVMLRRFREEQNLGPDEKLTYAGRLDPMAEGIVPILSGPARFRKDHLMSASKTYEVDILLGIGTDTGDTLGLVNKDISVVRQDLTTVQDAIGQLSQITEMVYPSYSSRPVDGKPLFMHARAGNKVSLPIKKVTIYSLELLDVKELPLRALLSNAQKIIEKVQGDFRQEKIIAQWRSMMEADPDSAKASTGKGDKIQVITIRTTVSSGTYMRSLAEKMGKLLKVPALAYRIVRTEVEEK
jgi:tRNA pseudouridine(55) synthase